MCVTLAGAVLGAAHAAKTWRRPARSVRLRALPIPERRCSVRRPQRPSVIFYGREMENGVSRAVALPYVDSEAEVGKSATAMAITLSGTRKYLATKKARKDIEELVLEDFPFGEPSETSRSANLAISESARTRSTSS